MVLQDAPISARILWDRLSAGAGGDTNSTQTDEPAEVCMIIIVLIVTKRLSGGEAVDSK